MADAISRLHFSKIHSLKEQKQNWMILTKSWCAIKCSHNDNQDKQKIDLNYVFAHRKDKEEIFPLTVKEIAKAQKKDKAIQKDKQDLNYESKLVENTCALQGWTISHPKKTSTKSDSLVPPLSTTPWHTITVKTNKK